MTSSTQSHLSRRRLVQGAGAAASGALLAAGVDAALPLPSQPAAALAAAGNGDPTRAVVFAPTDSGWDLANDGGQPGVYILVVRISVEAPNQTLLNARFRINFGKPAKMIQDIKDAAAAFVADQLGVNAADVDVVLLGAFA